MSETHEDIAVIHKYIKNPRYGDMYIVNGMLWQYDKLLTLEESKRYIYEENKNV